MRGFHLHFPANGTPETNRDLPNRGRTGFTLIAIAFRLEKRCHQQAIAIVFDLLDPIGIKILPLNPGFHS